MKKQILFCALSLLFMNQVSVAQTNPSQANVIDEVIWIVGDESILRSEVEEQRLRAQYEGTPLQGDPYCVIPEQIAVNKLFLHQAAIDSIEVNESNVMNQVENRLSYFISQIGSKEKMEEYFGKKTIDLREDLRTMFRDQMTIQQMQQKLVGDIKSTPADVRRFFNGLPTDSVPTVPAQTELQIISFEPPVPIEETNRIKERLRDFTDRISKATTDFSVLARLYSEDTESAKRGGELGFMGRGQLVPEFATTAFNLTDPKKVSRIVQTEFGYHIIQLIEKRGDRINCRHILLKPRISLTDKDKAIHLLDSIANQIRQGKTSFEQAVIYFSQDKNTAMNAGLMLNPKSGTSKFEYQDLPQEVAKTVYDMQVGELSKPFTMISPTTNKEVVAVVKVKSKTPNHKANLIDDYQMLKSYYEGKKKEEFITNWIIKKQKETYISIDPAWQNCKFQYSGWVKK
ncbi:MAG: peptidylprolyl isomerase [Porphyromonadaceae bacterium CG2_30_38_12]|nr:MAG: peptidylprolyl isomerase [Porphyromonadaceae bacterium CG2_30_38_12]